MGGRVPSHTRSGWWIRVAGTCACLGLLTHTVHAQTPDTPAEQAALATTTASAVRTDALRVYLGMWTTHLNEDVVALDNNWIVGISGRGYFGATFRNSFGRRAVAGGLQRTVLSVAPRPIGVALGFRLGFITGYDGRLMRLARKTPVLPLVQPFVSVDVTRVGLEVNYTFVVASAVVSYRF